MEIIVLMGFQREGLANWIHFGPVLLGHCFVDDGDMLSLLAICVGEAASGDHSNFQSLEIFGRNYAIFQQGFWLALWRNVAGNHQRVIEIVVAHRHCARKTSYLDPWQCLYARQK